MPGIKSINIYPIYRVYKCIKYRLVMLLKDPPTKVWFNLAHFLRILFPYIFPIDPTCRLTYIKC